VALGRRRLDRPESGKPELLAAIAPKRWWIMTFHKESEAMAEIRKIRAEISEEIKNLSPQEQVDKAKRESEEFEKEFRLKLPRVSKSKERSA